MQILTATDATRLFAPMLADCSGEAMAVAYLCRDYRVIAVGSVRGEADGVDLPIRDILAEALRAGAAGLIVAHNHPSGDPEPSRADVDATRRLSSGAAIVGLRLHDHLILGGGSWSSLRGMGLL